MTRHESKKHKYLKEIGKKWLKDTFVNSSPIEEYTILFGMPSVVLGYYISKDKRISKDYIIKHYHIHIPDYFVQYSKSPYKEAFIKLNKVNDYEETELNKENIDILKKCLIIENLDSSSFCIVLFVPHNFSIYSKYKDKYYFIVDILDKVNEIIIECGNTSKEKLEILKKLGYRVFWLKYNGVMYECMGDTFLKVERVVK